MSVMMTLEFSDGYTNDLGGGQRQGQAKIETGPRLRALLIPDPGNCTAHPVPVYPGDFRRVPFLYGLGWDQSCQLCRLTAVPGAFQRRSIYSFDSQHCVLYAGAGADRWDYGADRGGTGLQPT